MNCLYLIIPTDNAVNLAFRLLDNKLPIQANEIITQVMQPHLHVTQSSQRLSPFDQLEPTNHRSLKHAVHHFSSLKGP